MRLLHFILRALETLAMYLVFCVVVLLGSCHRSGTWNDDPKNWQRAFGERTPTNITVIHSQYWRSPHWTMEYAYFFEMRGAVRSDFLADTNLVRLGTNSDMNVFTPKPTWFAPKSVDQYKVYGYTNSPPSNVRILIDKTDETTFITDFQL
jgi:hypothetical protein